MVKKEVVVSIIVLLSMSFFIGCTEEKDNKSWGDAPDFSLTTLEDDTITLSDFQGKVILLDFTGVNCGWCVPQTIVLEQIRNEYSKEDLIIITIDVWGDSESSISNLLEAYRCKSPCEMETTFSHLQIREFKSDVGMEDGLELDWYFGIDSEGEITEDYVPNTAVPKIVIIDKDGNIYYTNSGYTQYSTIKNTLDELTK